MAPNNIADDRAALPEMFRLGSPPAGYSELWRKPTLADVVVQLLKFTKRTSQRVAGVSEATDVA